MTAPRAPPRAPICQAAYLCAPPLVGDTSVDEGDESRVDEEGGKFPSLEEGLSEVDGIGAPSKINEILFTVNL